VTAGQNILIVEYWNYYKNSVLSISVRRPHNLRAFKLFEQIFHLKDYLDLTKQIEVKSS